MADAAARPASPPLRKALVVGGMSNFIAGTIARRLLKHGVEVAWHWPMDHGLPASDIPAGADLVLLFVEMVRNRNVTSAVKAAAASAGVPMLFSTRKAPAMTAALVEAGFPEVYGPVAQDALQQPHPDDADDGADTPPASTSDPIAEIRALLDRMEADRASASDGAELLALAEEESRQAAAEVKRLTADRDEWKMRAERAEREAADLRERFDLLKRALR